MEPRWGRRLGRYELVAELGRGAMGVVYKARDPKIDRFVALKTISLLGADVNQELEYRERFFQEAHAVGRLVHPGIVTVFDVGEEPEGRIPYIVMEYVSGLSLGELLMARGGKLPLNTCLQFMEELAEAVDYAHTEGVVHRDIKPANILVTTTGHAKITDFGIAQLNLAHLTLPGQAFGTPAYMSPEQLSGDRVDGRSDLFSLGVILYSMVSGHRPFQGNSISTVCFKLANHNPVPPSALSPDLPAALDVVIARAMAKDPEERYQRGLEFALDLQELRERGVSLSSRASGPRRLLRGWTVEPPRGLAVADRKTRQPQLISIRVVPKLAYPRSMPKIIAAVLILLLALLSWSRWSSSAKVSARKAASSPPDVTMKKADFHPQASDAESASKLRPPTSSPATAIASSALATRKARSRKAASSVPGVTTKRADFDPQASNAESSPKERPATTAPATAIASSTLAIRIDHRFAEGRISVRVDDELAFSHSLQAKKEAHLIVFRRSQGHESGTVRVATGEHHLRVHVQSQAEAYDQSKSVVANFTEGRETTLQISFRGQQKQMQVELR